MEKVLSLCFHQLLTVQLRPVQKLGAQTVEADCLDSNPGSAT